MANQDQGQKDQGGQHQQKPGQGGQHQSPGQQQQKPGQQQTPGSSRNPVRAETRAVNPTKSRQSSCRGIQRPRAIPGPFSSS